MNKSRVQLDDLKPAPYNPRKIDDVALAGLAATIADASLAIRGKAGKPYKLAQPVLVNNRNNRILGGHQRVAALRQLGQSFLFVDDVWRIDVEPDSPAEKKLVIGLNNEHVHGRWDYKKLGSLFSELDGGGLDLGSLGWPKHVTGPLLRGKWEPPPIDDDEATAKEIEQLFGGKSRNERHSKPLAFWKQSKLFTGDVLDYGCGKRPAAGCTGWDPFQYSDPAPLVRRYDRVMLNYVLNVQPADHLVTMIAALVRMLLKPDGLALFAIRRDLSPGLHRSDKGIQNIKEPEAWVSLLSPFFQIVQLSTDDFLGFKGLPLHHSPDAGGDDGADN